MLCRNKISAARVRYQARSRRKFWGCMRLRRRTGTRVWQISASLPALSVLSHTHARAHSIGRRAQKRNGGQVKMEKVLGLAVVSSILCVGSVLGKYVRGIVNTKEVSIMFTFYCCCAGNGSEFSGVLAAHLLVAVINGLLWQVCIHASAFACIWKPDALLCFDHYTRRY